VRRKTTASSDRSVRENLKKDPDFAISYLKAAFGSVEDRRAVPIALLQVAQARGVIGEAAKTMGKSKRALARLLLRQGDPEVDTLRVMLKVVGLKLTVRKA